MALVGKMGRVREVLVKAKEFIIGFAKGLRESEVSGLGPMSHSFADLSPAILHSIFHGKLDIFGMFEHRCSM
jgi:hypothetical protein